MSEKKAPSSTAYTRTLQLAADTLGGVASLAARLDVPADALTTWIAGTEFPRHEAFLKALDIVAHGPLYESPQKKTHRTQSRADRLQASANRVRESAERLQSSADLAQAQAALLRQSARRDGEPAEGELGQIQPKDGAPASNKPGEPDKKSGKG